MKIAILLPDFSKYSGPGKIAELQTSEFIKHNHYHYVSIFTFKASIPTKARLVVIKPIRTQFLERIYQLTFPMNIFSLVKYGRRLKNFDIILVHPSPIGWLAYFVKKVYKKKYISFSHHIENPQLFSRLSEKLYMRIYSFLIKVVIRNADSIISVSKFSQKQLKEQTGLDSEVVYNGIDINRFREGIDGSEIRRKYSLTDNPIILYVGRIVPYKGIHLLIESFKLVKHEIPNAKLVIVGKHRIGHYSTELKKMSDDSVIFTGYLSDEELNSLYATCDVYATASLLEGFNLPLVEAQACGKPVVAFDIGPHPEIVKNKETGFLVPAGDVKAFANALIRLLKDKKLATEFGQSGCTGAKEKFSIERNVEAVLMVCQKLVEKSK